MKKCPTCNSNRLNTKASIISCEDCGTSAFREVWDNRPGEDILFEKLMNARTTITELENKITIISKYK